MTIDEAVEYLQQGIEAVDDGLRIDEGRFLEYAWTIQESATKTSFFICEVDKDGNKVGNGFTVEVMEDRGPFV